MQITNGSPEHNPQSALKDALAYLDLGWWLLPCQWSGHFRKAPLVRDGFYHASNDPEQIRKQLAAQVCAPVLWERSMRHALAQGITSFLEPGPGQVLAGILGKIDATASVRSAATPASLDA